MGVIFLIDAEFQFCKMERVLEVYGGEVVQYGIY